MIRWLLACPNSILMKRANGWLTLAWAGMMPVAIITGWIYSVAFISVVSIYANMTGHLGSWSANKIEVKQEEATPPKLDS